MTSNLPLLLVLVAMTGAAVVAAVDASYRQSFMELVKLSIVGFWAWMQAPRRDQ